MLNALSLPGERCCPPCLMLSFGVARCCPYRHTCFPPRCLEQRTLGDLVTSAWMLPVPCWDPWWIPTARRLKGIIPHLPFEALGDRAQPSLGPQLLTLPTLLSKAQPRWPFFLPENVGTCHCPPETFPTARPASLSPSCPSHRLGRGCP